MLTKTPSMPPITLFAPLNTFSCFGQTVCEIFASLVRHGWDVTVKPTAVVEECAGQQFPVPLEIKDKIDVLSVNPLELLIAPLSALALPSPGKATVYWPLLDTEITSRMIEILGRSEILIANSEWSQDTFTAAGLSPTQIIEGGVPAGVFYATPITRPGNCIFGTGGPPITPGSRRMVEPVINAFQRAFDGIANVELRIYLPFVPITPPADARVKFESAWKPNVHLCRWFHGLHAFVASDVEDGGLVVRQAMASGRPVIGWDWAEPPQYPISAQSGIPIVKLMAEQMRRVYIDRRANLPFDQQSAEHVKTWTGDKLDSLLRSLC